MRYFFEVFATGIRNGNAYFYNKNEEREELLFKINFLNTDTSLMR